jgi:hypothetical protein
MKYEREVLRPDPQSFGRPKRRAIPARWLALCVVIAVTAVGSLAEVTPGWAREPINWVSLGQNGRLAYGMDERGNRVPDFSTAGYRAGSAIPEVKVARRVEAPSGGDDTAVIQAALDALSQNPVNDAGLRGALELGPGKYTIAGSLRISASGIVLRGAGVDKTILHGAGEQRPLLVIGGRGTWKRKGEILRIDEDYVPVGATSVRVKGASELKAGDRIIVQRPFTREWISVIGMDRIPARSNGGKVKQWEPGPGLLFDRTVVAVTGDRIELNAPLTNALASTDGAVVWQYEFDGRISDVGVEHLSAVGNAPPAARKGRQIVRPRTAFVAFHAVENSWMQDVVIEGYTQSVAFGKTASGISVQRMKIRASPEIEHRGALPMAVAIDGQNILVSDCEVSGVSYMAWATQGLAVGPNVVRNCRATGDGASAQAHQRWATGLLFDNIVITGSMHLGNRGNMGTGQGWSSANGVLWNGSAETWRVENPPTAYNWAFGMLGRQTQSNQPRGEIVSPGQHVKPQSLYEQQLIDRTGRNAGQSR